MDLHAIREQVAGILIRARVRFQIHRDGASYRLVFGRDAVFIHFEEWDGDVRALVTAPALLHIDEESAGGALASVAVADLNAGYPFVKWELDGDMLVASHDLLGEQLQSAQLLHAVRTIARAVEEVGEDYAEDTGGVRYADVVDLEEVEDD